MQPTSEFAEYKIKESVASYRVTITIATNRRHTPVQYLLTHYLCFIVMEVKQYLPRYSRRFTTTNIQEHGYIADHFSTGSSFNNIKYPLKGTLASQIMLCWVLVHVLVVLMRF